MIVLIPRQVVLTANCPYPEVPLQSERSDWNPAALSLHQTCIHIQVFLLREITLQADLPSG